MAAQDDAVAVYKRFLAGVLERRPSGTRQRLAAALGKNRSFVSQIANPAYITPIPAAHLDGIFDLCHFSAEERRQFIVLYERAHPGRAVQMREGSAGLSIELPDLGDKARNRKLQALVGDFVTQMVKLLSATDSKGRTP